MRAVSDNIPVVMHGGSGVSKDDFKKAIEAGVRKVNYFTYMDKSGGNAAELYIKGLKDGEPVFFSSIVPGTSSSITFASTFQKRFWGCP